MQQYCDSDAKELWVLDTFSPAACPTTPLTRKPVPTNHPSRTERLASSAHQAKATLTWCCFCWRRGLISTQRRRCHALYSAPVFTLLSPRQALFLRLMERLCHHMETISERISGRRKDGSESESHLELEFSSSKSLPPQVSLGLRLSPARPCRLTVLTPEIFRIVS